VICSDESGLFYCTHHTAPTTFFLLCRPEIRLFVFRSDESVLLYRTDQTAQTSLISVVASRISDESGLLYFSDHTAQTTSFLSGALNFDLSLFVPTNQDSCTVQITRLIHLSFCFGDRNFNVSWFVPTNRDFCTFQSTRLKQASFLLWRPEIRPFVIRSHKSELLCCTYHLAQTSFFLLLHPKFRHFIIRSDVSGLLYCAAHTAQTSSVYVVASGNLAFRVSFRRLVTIVQYRTHGSIKLHFCCGVRKFAILWFDPTNQEFCALHIAQLKQASFLLWHSKMRPYVTRSEESGFLYCKDHRA
jgi:hypothetical protein